MTSDIWKRVSRGIAPLRHRLSGETDPELPGRPSPRAEFRRFAEALATLSLTTSSFRGRS